MSNRDSSITSRDRNIERQRYDNRAFQQGNNSQFSNHSELTNQFTDYHRIPYLHYESIIASTVKHDHVALEIGSGSGLYTTPVLKTGATTIISDISLQSLLLNLKTNSSTNKPIPISFNMESFPFADESIDCITSAGSLSYGDNAQVLEEIFRVLKPGGSFICVDSLNHNPIYKINRWIHYLRGNRALSTIHRIPTLELLESYKLRLGSAEFLFFGSLIFLAPFLSLIIGTARTSIAINYIDRLIGAKRSAFKFVMHATKSPN